jgi:hypothetical protein
MLGSGGGGYQAMAVKANLKSCSDRGLSPGDQCVGPDGYGGVAIWTKADYDAWVQAKANGYVAMEEQVVRTGLPENGGWEGQLLKTSIREWRIGDPIPGVGGPMDPFEVDAGACFAQGKYRPVRWLRSLTGRTHAFWYVQDSSGVQYILSGGPNGSSLGVWASTDLTSGEDKASDPTFFSSEVSCSICGGVDSMVSAAKGFPQGAIEYSPAGGPNSNSVAYWLGSIGGFESRMTAPPNTMAWGRAGLP